MFKAILLSKDGEQFKAQVAELAERELPEGDVTVRVAYSTLNYKDALAITNKSPIVRTWPMVAGIDAAGEVEESTHPLWKKGDRVVINGWGLSETHWGGLAQKVRVKGEWCTRLPVGMTARQAMAIGTACGLGRGTDLPGTVAPFILRGGTLRGISSVTASPARRQKAWDLLSAELDKQTLESMTADIGLDQAIGVAPDFIASKVRGR